MQKKAVFLDRDGIINEDIGYMHRVQDCVFVTGIFELAQAFRQQQFELIMVTNQSGIGRGYYSKEDFWRITDWMLAQFHAHNIHFLGVYYCPHHPTKAQGAYLKACDCRKPQPGMILQAIQEHDIDPQSSWLIGDSERDIQAAHAAKIKRRVLVTQAKVENSQATHVLQKLDEVIPLLSLANQRADSTLNR